MKSNANDEVEKKKRKEEMDKKMAEDAAKAKLAEEAQLPAEEREKIEKRKEAESIKAKGNDHYKNKNFDEALKLYQEAIDTNPDEPMFFSNMAACYFEKKEF